MSLLLPLQTISVGDEPFEVGTQAGPWGYGWVNILTANAICDLTMLHGPRGAAAEVGTVTIVAGLLPLQMGGKPDFLQGFKLSVNPASPVSTVEFSAALFEPGQAVIAPNSTQVAPFSAGATLDTTDGVTDVNPTTQLFIADGIALTNPSPGEAQIALNVDSPDGSITVTLNGPTQPVDLSVNFPTGTHEVAQGAVTTLPASGATVILPWAHLRDAHLLNYATATKPIVNAAGEYAFTFTVAYTNPILNDPGQLFANLVINAGTADAQSCGGLSVLNTVVTGSMPVLGVALPQVGGAITQDLLFHAPIQVIAAQGSGAARDVQLTVSVSKLS